jgi:hypothetical protein
MVRFGIQAPHEQINPTALLNDVMMMERYAIKKMLVHRSLYALVAHWGYIWCGLALAWGSTYQNR